MQCRRNVSGFRRLWGEKLEVPAGDFLVWKFPNWIGGKEFKCGGVVPSNCPRFRDDFWRRVGKCLELEEVKAWFGYFGEKSFKIPDFSWYCWRVSEIGREAFPESFILEEYRDSKLNEGFFHIMKKCKWRSCSGDWTKLLELGMWIEHRSLQGRTSFRIAESGTSPCDLYSRENWKERKKGIAENAYTGVNEAVIGRKRTRDLVNLSTYKQEPPKQLSFGEMKHL